ncbi:MAG: Ig-like domain-containing protein [Candidatus Parcubacteria bacterium]|nr:Ig-like domain-containing protein [Candidatus Parcubacteria bacterium]
MCNVYVAAGLYGTSCSPSNTGDEQITGPGRGIFEIHVQSGVQSPTIIRGVAITSPADNITVGAFTSYIGIAASAFSLNPVTKVEFYQQKSTAATPTLLFTDNSAPYSYIWASPTVGTYELTAKAYDSQGNFTSDPVTVIRQ